MNKDNNIEWLLDEEPQTETQVIEIVQGNDSDSTEQLNDGDVLGVLPLKNKVLFPGILLPITVSRPTSQKLIKETFEEEKLIAVVCQKEQDIQSPKFSDLYPLGTAAKIVRNLPLPDGSQMVILQGVERVMLDEMVEDSPCLKAKIHVEAEKMPDAEDTEFVALASNIKETAMNLLKKIDNVPQEALLGIKSLSYPPMLVDFVCANYNLSNADR